MINKELNFNTAKELDLELLYNRLLPKFLNIYEGYKYLELNNYQLSKIIKEIILKSLDKYDNRVSYIEYLIKSFRKEMRIIIKEKIDNGDIFNLINKYINYNNRETSNYKVALANLRKINNFFILIQYDLNKDLIIKLIKENKKFSNFLDVVSIRNNNITEDGVIYFLDTYCNLYDIPFYNHVESLNCNDDNYKKTLETLNFYLKEIGKYKLLKREEEVLLAREIKKGNKEARDIFFRSNLKLVVSLARRYIKKSHDLDFMDLIQEGNLGLLRAIEGFDPERGYRFSTYATNWILQFMDRAIKEKGKNIRLPVCKHEKIATYKSCEYELEHINGKLPEINEIASAMDISLKEAIELREIQKDTLSLNILVGEESENELIEFLPSQDELTEDIILNDEDKKIIKNVLYNSNLNKNEREVLLLRFGFLNSKPMSLNAIGKKMSLTRERIRQLQNSAIDKIKKSNILKELAYEKGYLDKLEHVRENDGATLNHLENGSIFISLKLQDFFNKKVIRFDNISKNTANIVFLLYEAKLTKKEMDFFILYYGLNISLDDIYNLYEDKYKNVSKRIIEKINNKIDNSLYNKEIHSYMDNYELILKEFDYDVCNLKKDTLISLFDEKNINFSYMKKDLIKKIVDIEYIKDKNNINLFILHFENILNEFNINELLIIYLSNKNISNQEIIDSLNIKEKDVLEILKKFYLAYKNNLILFSNLEYSSFVKSIKQRNLI